MQTVWFWILWGGISFWLLRTFYYGYNKKKLETLRRCAFGLELGTAVLFFPPWLPQSLGGQTGWELVRRGESAPAAVLLLIFVSILLLILKKAHLLKLAALTHMFTSVLFIVTMIKLLPDTYRFNLREIAPMIVALFLLIGNVAVLLLWQQVQMKEKTDKKSTSSFQPLFISAVVVFTLISALVFFQKKAISHVDTINSLAEVQEFKRAVEENKRSTFYISKEEFATAQSGTVYRVYEIFPDHQTTFNRYTIDEKGDILKYNGVLDTWDQVER